MQRYIRERPAHQHLKTLKPTATANESRAINDLRGECLVMAGAGMYNAGRIIHHLNSDLWNADTHVLIVGYLGHGSLGRRLVDGEEVVRIFGKYIAV